MGQGEEAMYLLLEFHTFKKSHIKYCNECMIFVIKIGDKICNLLSFYDNLGLTLDAIWATNPFSILPTCESNPESRNWYTGGTATF